MHQVHLYIGLDSLFISIHRRSTFQLEANTKRVGVRQAAETAEPAAGASEAAEACFTPSAFFADAVGPIVRRSANVSCAAFLCLKSSNVAPFPELGLLTHTGIVPVGQSMRNIAQHPALNS